MKQKTIEILTELKNFIANTMEMSQEDVSGDQKRIDDINECLQWLASDGILARVRNAKRTVYDPDWEMIQTAPHGIQYKHKKTGETKWE